MSNITTLHKGQFVLVDLVDETIELTVENNVYSRSEALELIAELEQAEPFLSVREIEEFEHKRYAMQPTKKASEDKT